MNKKAAWTKKVAQSERLELGTRGGCVKHMPIYPTIASLLIAIDYFNSIIKMQSAVTKLLCLRPER